MGKHIFPFSFQLFSLGTVPQSIHGGNHHQGSLNKDDELLLFQDSAPGFHPWSNPASAGEDPLLAVAVRGIRCDLGRHAATVVLIDLKSNEIFGNFNTYSIIDPL